MHVRCAIHGTVGILFPIPSLTPPLPEPHRTHFGNLASLQKARQCTAVHRIALRCLALCKGEEASQKRHANAS